MRLLWKGEGRVPSTTPPKDEIDCPLAFLAAIVNGVRALSGCEDTLFLAIIASAMHWWVRTRLMRNRR